MFSFCPSFRRLFFQQSVLPLLALLFASQLCGQSSFVLKVQASEQDLFWKNIKDIKIKNIDNQGNIAIFALKNNDALDTICRAVLQHFRSQSFLAASIDSLQYLPDSSLSAQFHLGPAMRWVSLQVTNPESERWVNAAGYRERLFDKRPLNYEAVLRLEQAILVQAENNGYPFAAVWLDSIEIAPDGGVSAQLQVQRNRYFSFSGIKIHGDVRLPKYFLPNYLGLQPGMPYSRARVLRLREQLESLLFLESTSNPSISFVGSEATVNLFLQKKRASRFDFIVGILPQPDKPDGKLLLTGSLSAAFQNALNLGERFSIDLERLQPETQRLDVSAGVPYLFGTPFGVDGRLGIYKRDSTWVDAQSDIGVQYLLAGGDYLRVLWENKSASLQKVDTALVRSSRQLPPNLDFKNNGFGLETAFSRLDYRFNPRKGWNIILKAVAGFNRVLPNSQIESLSDASTPEFQFASLYDSLTQRATRYRLEGHGAFYIPVFERSAIKLALRAGGIFSNRPVFANEQYRLGGNKLLRGFDEESLQATRFAVATAEWRLLIGKNSFLAAFTDWGYTENITQRTRVFLRPLGVGAGLNFETKAGIFGINVAVGRRDTGQAFSFRAAKFHLGYVSLF